jgi:hypothetical protein
MDAYTGSKVLSSLNVLPMPEAAMDEDDGFVFRQNDVGANVANVRILDFRF